MEGDPPMPRRARRRSEDVGILSEEQQSAILAGFVNAGSYHKNEEDKELIAVDDAKAIAMEFLVPQPSLGLVQESFQACQDGLIELNLFVMMVATLQKLAQDENAAP
eukprot:TRINITY_DN4662_c0_g1_i5.p2 TRINITY_DN4662_c0_g1~~TRINITY_DN4662_c0_g1_i5.p2  ORF type:complete len:107 (+),score=17.89 TRINITY_DN4662_c0_g1_i5:245-565(+)